MRRCSECKKVIWIWQREGLVLPPAHHKCNAIRIMKWLKDEANEEMKKFVKQENQQLMRNGFKSLF
jgi:hypothetical protein